MVTSAPAAPAASGPRPEPAQPVTTVASPVTGPAPLFSFFTCTYNRAHTLHRTWDSIRAQTLQDFEWVVFDNGSTDGTLELLKGWQREAGFRLEILHWPGNTGFQRTLNEGIRTMRGRFWLELDSDDACVPATLERFVELWESIPEEDRDGYAGVTVRCVDQHGNLVGDPLPRSPLDSTHQELEYVHRVGGEKWGFTRLDVLRRFPFADVPAHVNGAHVWRAIGREYLTRFADDALRIYWIDEPGRKDQLSHHLIRSAANAYGRRLNALDALNNDLAWFPKSPKRFLEQAVVQSWFANHLDVGLGAQLREIRPALSRALTVLAWPAGKALYWWPRVTGAARDRA